MGERDNTPISTQFAQASYDWCQKSAAADLLEECKSATLSQRMQLYADEPVNRAEMKVKSSDEWRDYLEKMVEARKAANIAKVKCEYLRMKFQEWSSAQANERLQAKL